MLGNFVCRKAVAKMLCLVIVFLEMLYPDMANAAAALDENQIPIRITVENQDFSATLYDNETTRAWVEQMPMTLNMSELNSNEKYYYLPESLPANSMRPSAIHTGDLMLYGSSCIVLFYKDFNTSYSYTPLGYMEDPTGLAEALGDGSVTVSFRLSNEEPVNGKNDLQNFITLESVLEQSIREYSIADSDKDRYTEESWTTYQNAWKEAEDLKAAGGYTEESMNQKIIALKCAYEGLKIDESPEEEPVKVQTIELFGDVTKLAQGKKAVLEASVLPENASKKDLKWTTSNQKIAAVNNKGVVTGKGKGTAAITAEATDGSGIKQTYRITVVTHAVKKIILFLPNGKKVKAGKKIKVTASVSTTGKTANRKLVWTTSNPKYATVNSKGMVTTKKAGKGKAVLVTARATDGSGKKAAIRIKIE